MLKFEIEEQELLDRLVETIGELPHAHASIHARELQIGPRGRVDALIDVVIAGRPFQLLVEAKREAFPRDVRETVWQLRNYLAHLPSDGGEIIPFFVARAISPGARQILREEGVGFYDLGGTLSIPAPNAFVYIDRPPPRKTQKIFDSVFQGQKARVVMAVFERRREWLSVKELSETTEVSPATASSTLTEMERREWVDVEGSGPSKLRRLRAAEAVLDAWQNYILEQKPPKLGRYYVPVPDVQALSERLDRACGGSDYAVTAELAAQAYAAHLSSISQIKCRIVPGPQQKQILDRLDARPVSEGWNLGVIETRARGDVTVGERIDGVALAPPLQVYLDLLQGSGRSKEMAAHLRAERLGA
jgi:hypothetical protein